MRHVGAFVKEIRREDFWIIPFTFIALLLGGYAATTQKPALWWLSGIIIVGMFIFSGALIAVKYNRMRSFLHIAVGGALLILATRLGMALM